MFKNVDFGSLSAENEAPQLLSDGFYHRPGLAISLQSGPEFLVLGYKGSGKSAVARHFKLMADNDSGTFVTLKTLDDFSSISADDLNDDRFASYWQAMLLLCIISSFTKDNAGFVHSEIVFDAAEKLEKLGLLDSERFSDIGLRLRTPFRFELSGFLSISQEVSEGLNSGHIPHFAERLKAVCGEWKSDSSHYLVIDGLDDWLRLDMLDSIMGLIRTASRINQFFREKRVNVKIIVLCRTELFDRLSDANKNKIRSEFSTSLDWHSDGSLLDSMLVKLADQRCFASLGEERRLISMFEKERDLDYVLSYTRHTPRDFLEALREIQRLHDGPDPVRRYTVERGLTAYSKRYFYDEIRDEVHGYLSVTEIEYLFEFLGQLRQAEFHMSELQQFLAQTFLPAEVESSAKRMIKALFDCSALGNVRVEGNKSFYTFRYRNLRSSVSFGSRVALHFALRKALNVV